MTATSPPNGSDLDFAALTDDELTQFILSEQAGAAEELGLSRQHASNALFRARKCGDALLVLRKRLRHGKWMRWIDRHFPKSYAAAYQYIYVAKNWTKIEPRLAMHPNLSIAAAIRFTRSTPAPEPDADPDDELPMPVPVSRKKKAISAFLRQISKQLDRQPWAVISHLQEIEETLVESIVHWVAVQEEDNAEIDDEDDEDDEDNEDAEFVEYDQAAVA